MEFDSSVAIWGESTTEVGANLSVSATRVDEIVEKGTISDAAINASSGTYEYGLGLIKPPLATTNRTNYLFWNLKHS